MYDEYLVNRIISATTRNELKWKRRIVDNAKLFICKYKLDGKKHLLIRVLMANEMQYSYLDIYMSGNIFIKRIDIMECSELYSLIFNLDYKV